MSQRKLQQNKSNDKKKIQENWRIFFFQRKYLNLICGKFSQKIFLYIF